MIDAGEKPLDWQKPGTEADGLLLPAPTMNAVNNASHGLKISPIPIICSVLPKHLLKLIEDKNISSVTAHQSDKYEPVVLYKRFNEQLELYVLDGGHKLAHDSLHNAVEKEDSAALERAAVKYGLIFALVWYPSNKKEPIKRILFTGNASYERVISALEKASSLGIFQHPTVTADMLPLKPIIRNRATAIMTTDSRTRPLVPRATTAAGNKSNTEKYSSRIVGLNPKLPSNIVKDGFKVPTLPALSKPNLINRKMFPKGNSVVLVRAQSNTVKSLQPPTKNVQVVNPREQQSDQQSVKDIASLVPNRIVPISDSSNAKMPEIITLDDTVINRAANTVQGCALSFGGEVVSNGTSTEISTDVDRDTTAIENNSTDELLDASPTHERTLSGATVVEECAPQQAESVSVSGTEKDVARATNNDEICHNAIGEKSSLMSDMTLAYFTCLNPENGEPNKITETSDSSLENSTTSEDTDRGSEDNGGDDNMRLIPISPYHLGAKNMSMSPISSLVSPDVPEDIKTDDTSITVSAMGAMDDMINSLSLEDNGFTPINLPQMPSNPMHMALAKAKPVLKNSRYFEVVVLPHSLAGVCNVDNLGDAGEFFCSVRSSMYISSGYELPGCLIPSWFAGKKSWKKPDIASTLCLTNSPSCVEMNEEEMRGEHCKITFTDNSTYTL